MNRFTLTLSSFVFFTFSGAVSAAWNTAPWTGDANSGIGPATTVWAYHFGSSTAAMVNGVEVPGLPADNPSVAGRFSVAGTAADFPGDENELVSGGGGSAVMAGAFIYGGNPRTVTLQGMVAGQSYTVSFFGVGFDDPPATRINTFSADAGDQLAVDEDSYGNNQGIRISYSFTAQSASRVFTITPADPGNTFHLYGLALNMDQSLSIDYYTVDGGGASAAPGTGLTLGGTIGQPDAAVLNRLGPLDLYISGGFWGAFASTVPVAAAFLVTTAADENDPPGTPGNGNSLRELVRDVPAGSRINFASTLHGQPITLTGEILLTKTIDIDASALPAGLTITDTGNVNYRLFTVAEGASVHIRSLTLANGGGGSLDYGGAIDNSGTLTLTRCTLTGNSAAEGGAIYNYLGSLTLDQCTLNGNSASSTGGGIVANGPTFLTHCTVSDNTAPNGGGIFNGSNLTMTHTIVAGNRVEQGPPGDIANAGTITTTGANIVPVLTGSPVSGPAPQTGDPLLAPLGDYGGPTLTMALRRGSPARDAASASTPSLTSDQRGFPIAGPPDIGAYEAGTVANHYNAYIWESLPPAATEAQHAYAFDYDGDGRNNGDEWLALTGPHDGNSHFRAAISQDGQTLLVSFPSVSGRSYTLQQNDSLSPATWLDAPGLLSLTGNDTIRSFAVPTSSLTVSRRFYRVTARRN